MRKAAAAPFSSPSRFPDTNAVFAINDPQAIGTNLSAKQINRANIIVTSVDGAPDIEAVLKDPNSPMIPAPASQDPCAMAQLGVRLGNVP